MTSILELMDAELHSEGYKLSRDRLRVTCNTPCAESASWKGEALQAHDYVDVLGSRISFVDRHAVTVHRIDAAWRAFHALKPVLLSRSQCRYKGLRLIESAVRPTVLWGLAGASLTRRTTRP